MFAELKDTEELMESRDYRDRLIAEYWQTCLRLEELKLAIQTYGDDIYPCKAPKWLLEAQLDSLSEYYQILSTRIRWEKTEHRKERLEARAKKSEEKKRKK